MEKVLVSSELFEWLHTHAHRVETETLRTVHGVRTGLTKFFSTKENHPMIQISHDPIRQVGNDMVIYPDDVQAFIDALPLFIATAVTTTSLSTPTAPGDLPYSTT